MRFTDRSILGTNYNCRIIGVRVWADKATFALCGLQCIYRVGRNRKMGGEYVKGSKTQYTENAIELEEGDYFKYISGALSNNNTVEYVIFMSVNQKVVRYGVVRPQQKQFNFEVEEDEVPVCLYGSLLTKSTKPLMQPVSANKNPAPSKCSDWKSFRTLRAKLKSDKSRE